MIDILKQYNRMGLPLLPLKRNSKEPLYNFKGANRLTDDDIERIWSKDNYNVGVRLSKLLVIDLDRHGESDGISNWESSPLSKLVPPTLEATTAGGGRHIFLKLDQIKCEQAIGLLEGVDIKTGPNAYVLIAPSSIDGVPYQFDTTKSTTIATAPYELIRELTRFKENKKRNAAKLMRTSSGYLRRRDGIDDILDFLVYGLGGEGVRNTNLASLIGKLAYRGVEPQGIANLVNVANEATQFPLDREEINSTLKSLLK